MKLHLGSAGRRLAGFLNVDREFSEGIDLVTDVSSLSAFEDETVEEIYSSHTFEYFDRDEATGVLQEWLRVLQPGGELYLSVPDFGQLLEIYKTAGDLQAVIGPLFGKWKNPNNDEIIYHRTVWDKKSLITALEKAGFFQVNRFDPIQYLSKIDPDYDDYSLAFYPHMDRTGVQVSLCVSGVKPYERAVPPTEF